jgi:hypothetical protein
MSPIPVILCGRTEKIAESVIATLQPEYEGWHDLFYSLLLPFLPALPLLSFSLLLSQLTVTVVHLILTPEAGLVQIPALLAGQPTTSDSALGSKNYSVPPAAVFLGAGYEDDTIDGLMKAAAANGAAKPVPWLRPDMTKPAPPLGPEYGKALVGRIKVLMAELQEKGEMNEAKVQWY